MSIFPVPIVSSGLSSYISSGMRMKGNRGVVRFPGDGNPPAPYASKAFSLSFWYKTEESSTTRSLLLLSGPGSSPRFYVNVSTQFQKSQVTVGAWDAMSVPPYTPYEVATVMCSTANVEPGYVWRNYLFSCDLNSGIMQCYVDNQSALHVNSSANTSANVRFSSMTGNTFFGNNPSWGNVTHEFADFWMSANTFIDFSDPQNRRKFINEFNKPVYLGENGERPLGYSPELFFAYNINDIDPSLSSANVNRGSSPMRFTRAPNPAANGFIENTTNSSPSTSDFRIVGIEGGDKLSYSYSFTPSTNSTMMTGSVWIRLRASNNAGRIFRGDSSEFANSYFELYTTGFTSIKRFHINFSNRDGSNTNIYSPSDSLIFSSRWQHFLWSIDLTSNTKILYIDGVERPFTETGDVSIFDFSGINKIEVGNPNGNNSNAPDIAELWIKTDCFLNLHNTSVRSNFSEFGKAKYLGDDGSLALTGTSYSGERPEIYFSGGEISFANNRGTYENFKMNSTADFFRVSTP